MFERLVNQELEELDSGHSCSEEDSTGDEGGCRAGWGKEPVLGFARGSKCATMRVCVLGVCARACVLVCWCVCVVCVCLYFDVNVRVSYCVRVC